jgi:hypothetical protein
MFLFTIAIQEFEFVILIINMTPKISTFVRRLEEIHKFATGMMLLLLSLSLTDHEDKY